MLYSCWEYRFDRITVSLQSVDNSIKLLCSSGILKALGHKPIVMKGNKSAYLQDTRAQSGYQQSMDQLDAQSGHQ